MTEVSDKELVQTIADFIEMGHIENIVAMFKQEKDYYRFVGDLIQDERFMVRMGMVILFEELKVVRPKEVSLAIPFFAALLTKEIPTYVRGEILTILGIIGSNEALEYVRPHLDDSDPQLAEIARDYVKD